MEKHIEKEYKLLVDKEHFDALLALYPDVEFKQQINYYYDNERNDIINSHGAMRIRQKNGVFIFTLKKPSKEGLMEFECPVSGNGSKEFDDKDIKATLNRFGITGPFQLIATLTTERGMHIDDDAELCFDISTYGDITDYEIEYEYRREHDGLTKFTNIISAVGLTYHSNSKPKIQRALQK